MCLKTIGLSGAKIRYVKCDAFDRMDVKELKRCMDNDKKVVDRTRPLQVDRGRVV